MFTNKNVRPSLLSRSLNAAKTINWSNLLDGTQKTLGVINQAIPIVYQVKPLLSNVKTMFKIVDAVKDDDSLSTSDVNKTEEVIISNNFNKPIFYI